MIKSGFLQEKEDSKALSLSLMQEDSHLQVGKRIIIRTESANTLILDQPSRHCEWCLLLSHVVSDILLWLYKQTRTRSIEQVYVGWMHEKRQCGNPNNVKEDAYL